MKGMLQPQDPTEAESFLLQALAPKPRKPIFHDLLCLCPVILLHKGPLVGTGAVGQVGHHRKHPCLPLDHVCLLSQQLRRRKKMIRSIMVSEPSSPGAWPHPSGGRGAGLFSWPCSSSTSHPWFLCRLPDPEDWGIGVRCGPLLCWDPPHPK